MTVKTNIGNITGTKKTLNSIVKALMEASDSYANRGLNSLSEYYGETFINIFDELTKTEYYK